jgi:uncharacterized damage-inducible protein DinB
MLDQTGKSEEQNLLLLLFRHHLWSNLRIAGACRNLTTEQLQHDDPGAYGSIRSTLIHLLRAEEWYLYLLSGETAPTPKSDEQTPLTDLGQRLQQSGSKFLQLLEDVQPEEWVKVGQGDEKEKQWRIST